MRGKYLSGNTRALLAYTTRTVVIFSSNLRRYSSVDIKELSSVVSKFPITFVQDKEPVLPDHGMRTTFTCFSGKLSQLRRLILPTAIF